MKKFCLYSLIFILMIYYGYIFLEKQQVKFDRKNKTFSSSILSHSFYGLLNGLLWLEFISLQKKGYYWEAYEYANWLGRADPYLTDTQLYLSWNASYNISVKMPNYDLRWFWVKYGLNFLQNNVLRYNQNPPIYWQISWIYLHKIFWTLDEANIYFKIQLAKEMAKVFGEYNQNHNWEKLVQSPTKNFFDRLSKILESKGVNFKQMEFDFRQKGSLPEYLKDSLELANWLDAYLRKRWLEQEYRFSIPAIIALEQEYGQFDWRLATTHAVFWAKQGMQDVNNHFSQKEVIACQQILLLALNFSYEKGTLVTFRETKNNLQFSTTTNLIFLNAYRNELKKKEKLIKSLR